MRLLDTKTKEIVEFPDDDLPKYAILSHTWEPYEVTLQDMHRYRSEESRSGTLGSEKYTQSLNKIEGCCEQALRHNLDWAWIDTCCIDKTNSAELSEAINSMFRWYNGAVICYVYFSDVSDDGGTSGITSAIRHSRWFSRGWTLQELVAPKRAHFYNSSWKPLGERHELFEVLHLATEIPHTVLKSGRFDETSTAQRMSWASKRQTRRKEDIAYCLLGLFDVNMPLLYGEGEFKAFSRLQQEIAKTSNDDSLFAWGVDETDLEEPEEYGLLARSPRDFATCSSVIRAHTSLHQRQTTFELIKGGVRMNLPVCKDVDTSREYAYWNKPNSIGVLNCRIADDLHNLVGITLSEPIFDQDAIWLKRSRCLPLVPYREINILDRQVATVCVMSGLRSVDKSASEALKIYYDPEFVSSSERMYKKKRSIRIYSPEKNLRWNRTLVQCDPGFRTIFEHNNSSSSPIGGLGHQASRGAYILYEAAGLSRENPLRCLLRVIICHKQHWPLRTSIHFVCQISNSVVVDQELLQNPNLMSQLSWTTELRSHSRRLIVRRGIFPDDWVLTCLPQKRGIRSAYLPQLKPFRIDTHSRRYTGGFWGGTVVFLLGICWLVLGVVLNELGYSLLSQINCFVPGISFVAISVHWLLTSGTERRFKLLLLALTIAVGLLLSMQIGAMLDTQETHTSSSQPPEQPPDKGPKGVQGH